MPRSKPKRDIYQEVTEKILDFIDRGNLPPWRHPIKGRGTGDGWPKSLASGNQYRGVNVFLLAITSWMKGYSSDYWLTFNQAKKEGAKVKKGEKGSLVVFWKQYTKTDRETGEEINLPVLRHYNVFNAEQCDDLKPPDAEADTEPSIFIPIEEAQNIVDGYKNPPTIEHVGKSAAYYHGEDKIKIALPERFTSSESYFATLFHEMVHSTGHEKRLNRNREEGSHVFGSPNYSKEELVAEFGSAFLCASAGISPPTIEQSSAYINGWRKKLKDDKKIVVQAAGLGQRAADHILGIAFDNGGQVGHARPTKGTSITVNSPSDSLHASSSEQFSADAKSHPVGLLKQSPPYCLLLPVTPKYVENVIKGARGIHSDWILGLLSHDEAVRLATNWLNSVAEKTLDQDAPHNEWAKRLVTEVRESGHRMRRLWQAADRCRNSPDFEDNTASRKQFYLSGGGSSLESASFTESLVDDKPSP